MHGYYEPAWKSKHRADTNTTWKHFQDDRAQMAQTKTLLKKKGVTLNAMVSPQSNL